MRSARVKPCEVQNWLATQTTMRYCVYWQHSQLVLSGRHQLFWFIACVAEANLARLWHPLRSDCLYTIENTNPTFKILIGLALWYLEKHLSTFRYAPRLPSPGETLHGTKFVTSYGGKGANQCVAAAKLGGNAHMISKVSRFIF